MTDFDLKWNRRFLEMAKLISTYSKDPSTKVGAVIVGPDKVVRGHGYNGFPTGTDDDQELYDDKEYKYANIVHAEINAIANSNGSVEGCTIFIYPPFMVPNACDKCAKVLVEAGIVAVVGYEPKELNDRWLASSMLSQAILDEGGVRVITVPPEND